ncbi:patatin-like phospholipase family protein [uncultured Paludibaculum sp.]|uniref:patatin-like phospholipase family protein n=1 Tax=uncultured Paludibaculum sp. TaxID=1765020 RepID=UPI002AAAAE41|nr:patatin-like phospholipase family protein [uncultured Paludibaculum sp.]
MRSTTVILLGLGIVLCGSAYPQEIRKGKERPKVGLVLAGGGAVGLVHVGVIRWLEEHHIPVDFIVGTSMGGMVASVYATGHTASEMATFVETIDWSEALRIDAPFRDLSFRRKEDRRSFPNALEFGLKGGFQLPMGLSPGQGVGLVISRIAAPYGDLKSFDDLPIPFRCVATDLVKGREVVFSGGSLFDALRATMSLPGVFAPLRLGDQVLVDGGVLNNLPVDVTRKMGAEVIIAVGLETSDADGAYDTLLAVVKRSLGVMVAANENRNLKGLGQADLILLPDVSGFSSRGYEHSKELAERGYQEAQRKARFLETLAVSDGEWTALMARRASRRRPEWIESKLVEVHGTALSKDVQLTRELNSEFSEPFDRGQLEAALNEVTGLGRYKSADYGFIRRQGQDAIQINVHEKSYGPPFLNTGLFISGSNSEGLKLGIAARLTMLDVLAHNSELRTDFSLGIDNRIATEYYYRLKGTRFFVAPGGFLYERSQDFYNQGNTALFSYKVRETGGSIDAGYAAGRFSELRLGYQLRKLHTYVSSGSPDLTSLSGMVGSTRLKFTHDRMDSIVPTSGLYFSFDGQWVNRWPGARKQFPILESRVAYALPIGEQYSLLETMSGGTTVSTGFGFPPFTLGGPSRLASLARQQLIGNHYYYNGLYLMRPLSEVKVPGLRSFRAMLGYELGNAFTSGQPPPPFHDGVVGLIRESPLGVVFFGASFGERGERKLFITVGRFFY